MLTPESARPPGRRAPGETSDGGDRRGCVDARPSAPRSTAPATAAVAGKAPYAALTWSPAPRSSSVQNRSRQLARASAVDREPGSRSSTRGPGPRACPPLNQGRCTLNQSIPGFARYGKCVHEQEFPPIEQYYSMHTLQQGPHSTNNTKVAFLHIPTNSNMGSLPPQICLWFADYPPLETSHIYVYWHLPRHASLTNQSKASRVERLRLYLLRPYSILSEIKGHSGT